MSNTTARTVTTAVRKALRLAGRLDRVSSVRTQATLANVTIEARMVQIPVWSTVVETVGGTEAIAEALKDAGFGVTHSSQVPGMQSYVAVRTPRVVEDAPVADVVPIATAVAKAEDAGRLVAKVTASPMTIGEVVVGKGRSATTVADLVSAFRAEGAKARRANAEGNHDIVPTTLANRIDMGKRLMDARLPLLVRSLFAEQQDLLALHPATKADPITRSVAQEHLSVARKTIAAVLAYPVAKSAQRAA